MGSKSTNQWYLLGQYLQHWIEQVEKNEINISFNICLFLDRNIQPISLSSGSDPSDGEMVEATGWGKPSDNAGGISPVLREVTVPVMSNKECDATYGIVKDSHICIDSAGGKGTCNVSFNENNFICE